MHDIGDVEALCAVQDEGIEGVICGRSIYEGTLDLRRGAGARRRTFERRPAARSRQPCLAKRIIPCLDVTAGRVVKGVNFVELRDAGDPVEIARRYDDQGADELTFLDITASSDERDLILHIIEAVAAQVFIPLTVGGGVREVEDVRRLLNAGADKVSINTSAVTNPQLVFDAAAQHGSQCIVVAIDAKQVAPGNAGRCSPTAGATPPGWTRSNGRARWNSWAPARSCSPAWTATAPSPASTWR